MEQYIKKSDIEAELDKRIANNEKDMERASEDYHEDYYRGYEDALVLFQQYILDTIEVKEVDLEKEFDKCCENYIFDDECEVYTAKHFFKLGLKAQKGE